MAARRQINRYSTKQWSDEGRIFSFASLPYSYAKSVAMKWAAKNPDSREKKSPYLCYVVGKTASGNWDVVQYNGSVLGEIEAKERLSAL